MGGRGLLRSSSPLMGEGETPHWRGRCPLGGAIILTLGDCATIIPVYNHCMDDIITLLKMVAFAAIMTIIAGVVTDLLNPSVPDQSAKPLIVWRHTLNADNVPANPRR